MWILKQYCGGDCWSLLRFLINIHQLCEYKDRVGEGECQNSLLTLYCNDTLWHHNVTIMCIDEWTWWLRWNRIRCTHRWINLRQRQCALISVSVLTHSCTWPQVYLTPGVVSPVTHEASSQSCRGSRRWQGRTRPRYRTSLKHKHMMKWSSSTQLQLKEQFRRSLNCQGFIFSHSELTSTNDHH